MLFEEQLSRKPNLYPWTQDFIDAMWQGHWTPNEFNFQSDVHDYKINLTDKERNVITNTLSAIAQIEVAVKKFWGKVGENLPHPSIHDLGVVMSHVECIHNIAYEKLLHVLNIEHVFESNMELDIIQGRVKYLRKYNHKYYKDSKKQYVYSLALFTLFVENVSLFSQFYIINWFNRYKNVLKDTAQQVAYTTKEECYLEGTEVLTPKGWIDFRNIQIGDDIVQYNPDGTFEYTKVLHKTVNDFFGNLIKFYRLGNECVVTPNHEMCYFDDNNNFVKEKAKNVEINNQIHFPKVGILKNDGLNNLSFEDRLKIAFNACVSSFQWSKDILLKDDDSYSIKIVKEEHQSRLEWILNELQLDYKVEDLFDGEKKYKFYFNKDSNYIGFDWLNLTNKNSNWCKEFIEELIIWGGCKDDDHVVYSSNNKEYIDIAQCIAILAGYYTNIDINDDNTYYNLSIMDDSLNDKEHYLNKTDLQYNGKVYCVTVPSGNIVTRINNNTFVSGNCIHALVGIKLINTIREEYPELFDDELEQRVLSEAEEAFRCESKIIDWILGDFEDKKINKDILKEFVKNRINESLKQIGFKPVFENLDEELLEQTQWFDEDILGNTITDFFYARPVNYAKDAQTFTEEDLF